ncbi:hypothetical protein BDZ94DRAFT_1247044, partial [Collybia nuda]
IASSPSRSGIIEARCSELCWGLTMISHPRGAAVGPSDWLGRGVLIGPVEYSGA